MMIARTYLQLMGNALLTSQETVVMDSLDIMERIVIVSMRRNARIEEW